MLGRQFVCGVVDELIRPEPQDVSSFSNLPAVEVRFHLS